jgi:hypothetical protein
MYTWILSLKDEWVVMKYRNQAARVVTELSPIFNVAGLALSDWSLLTSAERRDRRCSSLKLLCDHVDYFVRFFENMNIVQVLIYFNGIMIILMLVMSYMPNRVIVYSNDTIWNVTYDIILLCDTLRHFSSVINFLFVPSIMRIVFVRVDGWWKFRFRQWLLVEVGTVVGYCNEIRGTVVVHGGWRGDTAGDEWRGTGHAWQTHDC